jgi:muramoyltetrapeptide carboxypeptidase
MSMFTDRKVDGILCVRGGYGTARLLPLLDYPAIQRQPKVFVGYSDITSLHCAFLVQSNLISFHGPMLNSGLRARPHAGFHDAEVSAHAHAPEAPGDITTGYNGKVRTLRTGWRTAS